MTFLRRFLLASVGFACLELATRPHRRPAPADELSERAAAAVVELVLLDAELRGEDLVGVDQVREALAADTPRPLCLCDGCSARQRAAQRRGA